MTYFELDDAIHNAFETVPLVNSVYNNSLEWQTHKDIEYISVAYDLQNTVVNTDYGTATYTFAFVAGERGVESEQTRISNYSKLMEVLIKGFDTLENTDGIEIGVEYSFQFGSLKFMDVLDVCSCTVNVVVDLEYDCEDE